MTAGKYYDDAEVAMIRAAQGGDIEARNGLILKHRGFLIKKVTNAVGRDRRDEYMSHAVEKFINVIRLFNPDVGLKLLTYAGVALEREVFRHHNGDRLIRVPQGGRRSKSRQEAASRTRTVMSLDACRRDTGKPTDVRDRADHNQYTDEQRELLAVFMRRLGPSHSEIVGLRARGLTLRDVAMRMGMSYERVRQIEHDSIDRMRRWARQRERL